MTSLAPTPIPGETTLLRLAREIAADIQPLRTILDKLGVDEATWQSVQRNARFQSLLESETVAWNSALNTHERVKLKAAAGIEYILEDLFTIASDNSPLTPAKVELIKTLGKFANIGVAAAAVDSGGGGFKITINLGSDQKLTFEKELPPKVIDGDSVVET